MNAEGIKVLISGRLNGAEMARSEVLKMEEFHQLSSRY
jgi:ribosomal protein S3